MHAMAIRQRHVRQQRMRRDHLMDWWLEASGPYSGEVVDDARGDEVKQHLAETLTDPQDGAQDDSKAPNHPLFDSYIPLELQDSDGRSYNYQFGQRAVGVGPSPYRIRHGSQTPRRTVPVIPDLSAQLEDTQKFFRAQRDRLDAKIRESEIHRQRSTLLLAELENVKGESQRRKEGLHQEPGLAEHLWKELSQQLEGEVLDKPATAAECLQDKITRLRKKLGYANMEAALRQEKLERQDATATILREQVAQLLEELERQDATTASLYKQVTQLQLDLGGAKEERLQQGEETSLHTQIAPLLEGLEDQKATTASLYHQVTQLQLDLGGAREEGLQLKEDLKRAEMAMVDFRGQISQLTTLQSVTNQALQRQEAVADDIRQKVIQREEQQEEFKRHELKRQEELKRQDTTTASPSKQVAQLEELEREEATTASLDEDVAELLEELEVAETASEDLYGLASQLETLQNASEEALERQEAFADDLRQKITQLEELDELDELDGAAKRATRQQPEIEKENADTAAGQRQANQLVSSLPDAMYEGKTLQERVAELTAQLANTEAGDLTDHVIVNMEVHPVEVGYLNSRVVEVDGSRSQRVFNMDVHVL